MKPDEIPPGTVAQPSTDNPWPVAVAVKPDGSVDPFFNDRDQEHRVPKLDVLHGTPVEPPIVVALAPDGPDPETAVPPQAETKPRHIALWWVGVTIVVVLLAGASVYMLASKHQATPKQVSTPRPTPSATPSPTPSPAPSPSPSATPVPTPVPQTVTVPTVAPTASHPQVVTITSKSGLWLRSSPTSVNQSNVIDWMPDGAQISVDSTGSFWWHGTYNGKTGYFASKYTQ